jgi:hypothetical protein
MVAEIFIKNRLDALLGAIIGKLSVGNAPLIKAKDSCGYRVAILVW